MKKDGDVRMLGTRDGLAHALVWVRGQINAIDGEYAPRIDPRHKRKRAARDAVLRPLKELEARIDESQKRCFAAYEQSRG